MAPRASAPHRLRPLGLALALAGGCEAAPRQAASGPPDGAVTDAGAPPCSRPRGASPAPRYPAFAGPSGPIEVLRDGLGIPHIYGRSDEDAMYGAGYVQATDRLFQMDLLRRAAYGTLAEVLGPRVLAQDRLVRLVDIPRWGRAGAERLLRERPEMIRLVSAWVAGVNRRVRDVTEGRAPLPPGFRPSEHDYRPAPWAVDDVFVISKLILFNNANQLEYDILATILRDYLPALAGVPLFRPLREAYILPAEERPGRDGGAMARAPARRRALPRDFAARWSRFHATLGAFRAGASNNWALAGRHTFNGRPLIAGDPHQPLQSPPVFWAHHINSADAGGNIDVAGFGFAATPGVQLGHNRHVAWTATTTFPDFMDLWSVETDGATVRLGGRAHPVERCVETIAVRGAASEDYVVEDVPGQGVLLPRNLAPLPITRGSRRALFAWVGLRATAEAAVFFGLNRARTVDEVDAAVGLSEVAAFNFVAADARAITYRSRVLVPDRGPPRDFAAVPNVVLDGDDPRTLWTGRFLPDELLPRSRGGARGWLASANNDPLGFTANGRVDDDPFYFGVWFDPGTRAARIEAELTRLTQAGGVTLEQMKTLQNDTRSLLADELLPALAEALGRVESDPALGGFRGDARLRALGELLARWDRRMERGSQGAVVFEGFEHFLAQRVLADDFGPLLDAALQVEPVYVLKLTALVVQRSFAGAEGLLQGGRELALLRALADTRDWLSTRFGGVEPGRYTWADFHRTSFAPPFASGAFLDGGSVATDGSLGTVNVSSAEFFERGVPRRFHDAQDGAVFRLVASFREDGRPAAEVNFAPGNVADPASRFFRHGTDDWRDGRYRPLLFERAAVEAAAVERSTLAP